MYTPFSYQVDRSYEDAKRNFDDLEDKANFPQVVLEYTQAAINNLASAAYIKHFMDSAYEVQREYLG